jgi:hypothetical protein
VDLSGTNTYSQSSSATYSYGLVGDIPVVGRWTGGQDATHLNIGVYRGVGVWIVDSYGYMMYELYDPTYQFGIANDTPVMVSPVATTPTITAVSSVSMQIGGQITISGTNFLRNPHSISEALGRR